jgi:hypothetical protein
VDVSTNPIDSHEASLSYDAHALPIDVVELTCGMQQVGTSSTTMQNAPSLVNLQNAPYFVNVLPLPCLLARRTRENEPLINYNQSHVVTSNEYSNVLCQKTLNKKSSRRN